jgi:hypothetical protein
MFRPVRSNTRRPTAFGRLVLIVVGLFRPIVFVFGVLLRSLYQLLFSWWLNPIIDGWLHKAFADDLRHAMPFLFDLYDARLVPDLRPAANDPRKEYVCIGTQNLIFQFARWRRENYEVRVSPSFAPSDSYDLVDALRIVDSKNAQAFPDVDSWQVLSRFLEPRFCALEAAFSRDNFQETKVRLAKIRLMSNSG